MLNVVFEFANVKLVDDGLMREEKNRIFFLSDQDEGENTKRTFLAVVI